MDGNLAGMFEAVNNVVINGGDSGIDPDLKGILAGMHNVVINNSDSTSVNDTIIALGVIFMVVVLPMLIFGRRRGRPQGPSAAQEQASAELWDRARRMETRIEYLERVLDSEMPGWRNRS